MRQIFFLTLIGVVALTLAFLLFSLPQHEFPLLQQVFEPVREAINRFL